MKFALEITLGNAAMQGPEDIAEALRRVAAKVEAVPQGLELGDSRPIMDTNGNLVGSYELEPTDADEREAS